MSTTESYVAMLEAAAAEAVALDSQQRHDEAAEVLEAALSANWPIDGKPSEFERLHVTAVADGLRTDVDRQKRRAQLLANYLN